MSRERHGVDTEVSELERALRALAPRASQASHDRLLFAAGGAAERNRIKLARRFWMCAAGMPTIAAVVLALLLIEAHGRVAQLELALVDSVRSAVDANAVIEANPTGNPQSTSVRPTESVASTEITPTGESATVAMATGAIAPVQGAEPAPRGAASSGGMPRYLELRNRVLRLGVEALADHCRDTAGTSAEAIPLTNRALRRVYLPSPDRPPAG